MLQKLKEYFQSFGFISEKEIQEMLNICVTKKLNKTDYFISEGETCAEVAFVLSGIFRSFYSSNSGEELTYCIMFPGNFITAYSSFITSKNTHENIQAVTAAEILIIKKNDIEKLAVSNPNWMLFMRIMAETQYLELEQRVFQLQRDTASERYKVLLEEHPEYIKYIPLQYLASYLGITQRHLSRIRNQIAL